MRRTDPTTDWIATPLRAIGRRLSFLFLLTLGTALLLLGRAENYLVEQARTTVVDVITPVINLVSKPADAVSQLADEVEHFWAVYEENEVLRAENARLKAWHGIARRLDEENKQYRGLLNVVPEPRITFITARIIGDSRRAFVQSVLVNAGRTFGIESGQAVINGEGFVGRIVDAGRQASRVILMTDLNSRIPVIIEQTRFKGILTGTNTDFPQIDFLPSEAKVSPGDRVVTSGHGGMLPTGLPIGIVRSVENGVIKVQPHVDYDRLELVRVLRYQVPRDVEVGRSDSFQATTNTEQTRDQTQAEEQQQAPQTSEGSGQ